MTLHDDFAALYAKTGRPSIPPEQLLRASLIQTLYSIHSEQQLVHHIDYNLLYRWANHPTRMATIFGWRLNTG